MKASLPYTQAHSLATKLIDRFATNCERIELAGSLRRRKPTVGDIEIIAITTEALYAQLDDLLAAGKIRHREPRRAWGQKLRSFLVDIAGVTVQVDLFLQHDPATATPATSTPAACRCVAWHSASRIGLVKFAAPTVFVRRARR